ncbi:MAG: hypothetical protein KKC02_09045 [Gammaproteobacteria bacterium]|nr:hypothetical protein [Alphaproteobacteria bacterium]MBU1805190.1 hypothetical protein [Gammaproteobacteria bacterium]
MPLCAFFLLTVSVLLTLLAWTFDGPDSLGLLAAAAYAFVGGVEVAVGNIPL